MQLVEELAPDILMLDIRMPVMNGIEVLHHLQAKVTNVKVVVLSAHADSYSNHVLASGVIAFVLKGDIPHLRTVLLKLV